MYLFVLSKFAWRHKSLTLPYLSGNQKRFQCIRDSCRPASPELGVGLHDVRRHDKGVQSHWDRVQRVALPEDEFRDDHALSARSSDFRWHGEVDFSFLQAGGWACGGQRDREFWYSAALVLILKCRKLKLQLSLKLLGRSLLHNCTPCTCNPRV